MRDIPLPAQQQFQGRMPRPCARGRHLNLVDVFVRVIRSCEGPPFFFLLCLFWVKNSERRSGKTRTPHLLHQRSRKLKLQFGNRCPSQVALGRVLRNFPSVTTTTERLIWWILRGYIQNLLSTSQYRTATTPEELTCEISHCQPDTNSKEECRDLAPRDSV